MTHPPDPAGPVELLTEHHVATVRTGRYYTTGAAIQHTRQVWIVLHGYAQLASRILRHFEGIIPPDTLVVAPEALSRFYLELPRADGGHMARVGAAWMTREDRDAEIADTRGWLDSVYREVMDNVTRATGCVPGVNVLAFSQGVATCMRWIAGGVVNPSRVVLWAGGLATDVDGAALQARLVRADVLLVAGERDTFATAEARARIRAGWDALGVPVRELLYDGIHELHPPTLQQLLSASHP